MMVLWKRLRLEGDGRERERAREAAMVRDNDVVFMVAGVETLKKRFFFYL